MTRKFISLRQKKTILAEAFSKPNNIKPTARAYSVLPEQIRRWRTMFASLPVLPEDNSDEDNRNQTNRQLSQILNKKTAHQGHVRKSVGEFNILWSTFNGLRQQDQCCTIWMLAIELKRVAGNENVSLVVLSKRVKQWMMKEGRLFFSKPVTHVAQNTRRLIHCVQGNQWWTDKQAVSHQSTKPISGFSEILLPSQGLGTPSCLLELDRAGLEALDSGIPRRDNLPANRRLFGRSTKLAIV